MMIVLPDWYTKVEEKIDRTIIDISNEIMIDLGFVMDSKGIENGKQMILHRLVDIYENVNVEERKRQEDFIKKIRFKKEKTPKNEQKRKKTTSKTIRRSRN